MILFGRIETTWRHRNTAGELVESPLEAVSHKNWRETVFLPDPSGRSTLFRQQASGPMPVRALQVPGREAKAFIEAVRGKDLRGGHVGGLVRAPVLLASDEVAGFVIAAYGSKRKDLDVEILWDTLEGLAYENDRCVRSKRVEWMLDKERPRVIFALWPRGTLVLTTDVLLAVERRAMSAPGLSGIHTASGLQAMLEKPELAGTRPLQSDVF